MQNQAAIDGQVLSWQRSRILRTLDQGLEVSRTVWDGGDVTLDTKQGVCVDSLCLYC